MLAKLKGTPHRTMKAPVSTEASNKGARTRTTSMRRSMVKNSTAVIAKIARPKASRKARTTA